MNDPYSYVLILDEDEKKQLHDAADERGQTIKMLIRKALMRDGVLKEKKGKK